MNFTGAYETQGFYKKSDCRFLDCRDLRGVNGYCSEEAGKAIERRIAGFESGIHFIDGGNFHYMTYFMARKVKEPFTLVVFDHHTDMQPSAFAGLLSCGCWLKRLLAENHYLKNVLLLGVEDELAAAHEAALAVRSGRLHILEESKAADERTWPIALKALEREAQQNLYVSIDKDAFCRQEAVTDWDQGSMTLDQLETAWNCIVKKRRLLGVDICGEAERNFAAPEKMYAEDKTNDGANRRILKIVQST